MNVPRLRFREFTDEWEEKKLEKIFEISKSKYNPLKETKEYPCIELESLSQETGKLLKTFNSLEQKSIKNKFLKDEVLFGKLRPYLKKYWYSDFEGVCSSEIWVLNSKNNINKFIYYFIQGENFISLANTTSGTKMPRADWSLMKNEFFSIPTIQEQQKIADFLSSIDEKISITEEKLNLFKDYKKGIMQKIFNQKLRFKDSNGNDYPEWEDREFDNVFKNVQNKNYQIKNSDILSKGTIKVVDQGKNKIAGFSNEKDKVFKNIPIILYGDHTTIIKYLDFDFILGGDGTKLLSSKTNDNLKFLYYSLSYNNIVPEGYKRHFSILREIHLMIPSSLEEQQKIADFLSSIDNKIEKISDELENLKEFKKGLLQKMFA